MRVTIRSVAIAGLVSLVGCHHPLRRTDPDGWITNGGVRSGLYREGVLEHVLLFIPNRVVDLLEVFHVGVGVGVGIGVDVRVTQWAQLGADVHAGAGVQWDGRDADPGLYGTYATAAFGPWRGGVGQGKVAGVRPWEVAVAGGGAKMGVDLAEAADFVLGWLFIDILQDDYGWVR